MYRAAAQAAAATSIGTRIETGTGACDAGHEFVYEQGQGHAAAACRCRLVGQEE